MHTENLFALCTWRGCCAPDEAVQTALSRPCEEGPLLNTRALPIGGSGEKLGGAETITAVAASDDGKWVAAVGFDQHQKNTLVLLWKTAHIRAHGQARPRLCLVPNNAFVATC
jgi:hypothetical protein